MVGRLHSSRPPRVSLYPNSVVTGDKTEPSKPCGNSNTLSAVYNILDYMDSPPLRRNVHYALNRGEAYHRLRRAIAYAHGGRFRVRSQHEQELWNECTRLIADAVVYYNSPILSEVLQTLVNNSNQYAIDRLQWVTPLAWQHINFYGRYRWKS